MTKYNTILYILLILQPPAWQKSKNKINKGGCGESFRSKTVLKSKSRHIFLFSLTYIYVYSAGPDGRHLPLRSI
jgi:hypothetical protein